MIIIINILISAAVAQNDITILALDNGFNLSPELKSHIIEASQTYQIEPSYLVAVGIIESGLGKNIKSNKNKNGTTDHGIFQVNDVNRVFCGGLDVQDRRENVLCAAKLISRLKPKNLNDLAKYHSKTLKHKQKYYLKLTKVFEKQSDKYIVTSN